MAFPEDRLDVDVSILVDGAWDNIVSYVFGREGGGITIRRGASAEGSDTEPGSMSFELDNADARFSPGNPTSPYFGKIGRNTRIRGAVYHGDPYLDLPPELSGGHYVSTPDHADLDITGDIDIRVEAELVNWQSTFGDSTFRRIELLGKYTTTGNQRSWHLRLDDDVPTLDWSANGSTAILASATVAPSIPPDGILTLRATLDVDNGSGGYTVTFYTSTDGVNGTFTQLGEPVVTTAGTTSIFSSTTELRVGEGTNFAVGKARGRVLHAQVRNGIGGTIVANPDFSLATIGAATLVDSAGRTWTVNGEASFTNRQDRFQGRITTWNVRWQTGGFDPHIQVQADGVMRRIGRGSTPLDSAIKRELTNPARTAIVGYWPMEDGSDATEFTSARPGDDPLVITGDVNPAGFSEYAPSGAIATFDTGTCYGRVAPYDFSDGEANVRFVFVPPTTALAADNTVVGIYTGGTPVNTWAVRLNTSNEIYLRGYDEAGIVFTSSTIPLTGGVAYNIGVELTQNGADIDWDLFAFFTTPADLDLTLFVVSQSGTAAGNTLNRVRAVRAGLIGVDLGGAAVGHIAVSNAISGFANTGAAIVGYFGEKFSQRFRRVMEEENVYYSREIDPVETGSTTSETGYNINTLMGSQGELTLMGLLRETEETAEGVLFESKYHGGLVLKDASSLSGQTPVTTIDYTGDHGLVVPFEPQDDDQYTMNWVELSRIAGGTGVHKRESGPMNISEPEDDPEGVGVYRSSFSRDLYRDSAAVQHAAWLVHLGTWAESRYPRITVLLQNSVAKIPEYLKVDVGRVIEVTNLPEYVAPDSARLLVRGYSEFISQFEWELTFNLAPAGPYDTPVTDSETFGRLDTAGSQIAVAVDSDDTALKVWTTDGPLWTTDDAEYPFDVKASGERMAATDCTSSGSDDFSAAVGAGGWGTSDIGGAWTVTTGTAANFSVSGGEGLIDVSAVNSNRIISITAPDADTDTYVTVDTEALATGAAQNAGIVARGSGTTDYYYAQVAFNTAQTVTLSIQKRVADVASTLTSVTLGGHTHAANTPWRLRFKVEGSSLYFKAWPSSLISEPQHWNLTATDTSLTSAGYVGVRCLLSSGNTNTLPLLFTFDNFEIVNPQIMTVTRSDNGVVKSHAAGTGISLDRPVYTAL